MKFEEIKDECPHKINTDGILKCGKRKLAMTALNESLCIEANCFKAWRPVTAPKVDNNRDTIEFVELLQFDHCGVRVESNKAENITNFRLSVFFPNLQDQHHLHIPADVTREEIARQLRCLSELILQGGE